MSRGEISARPADLPRDLEAMLCVESVQAASGEAAQQRELIRVEARVLAFLPHDPLRHGQHVAVVMDHHRDHRLRDAAKKVPQRINNTNVPLSQAPTP